MIELWIKACSLIDRITCILSAGLFLEKHCPIVIGHTNARGGGYFKGYMDEVSDVIS